MDQNASRISAVILAAGKGTRMKSDLPKVLHTVCGKTLLDHVIASVRLAGVSRIGLVLSTELDAFETFLEREPEVDVCIQSLRRGTGDAVASAAVFYEGVKKPRFAQLQLHRGSAGESDHVLICAGDTPALDPTVMKEFLTSHIQSGASVSVLGMKIGDPTGYGRLVLSSDGKSLLSIVEHKDASEQERKIDICNTGVFIVRTKELFEYLDLLTDDNVQNEYYLTDIVAIARRLKEKDGGTQRENAGAVVQAFVTDKWEMFQGVNTPEQKASVEAYMQSLG